MKRGVVVPLLAGVVAAGITVFWATHDTRRALVAWVAAYGFGLATALAGLVIVMVLHVTGASWWLALRRVFMATCATTPLFALLFVPIGASVLASRAGDAHSIYPWIDPPAGLDEHLELALQHQRAWNEPRFFIGRAVFYLATWTVLAVLVRRADEAYLSVPSPANARDERRIGAVGLPIMAFAITFAAFDWLMSLQPGWVSNMFGLYVFTSGLVAALAIVAVGSWLAARMGLLPDGTGPEHFHALGRLMLMSVVLWAYIAFFQLLLVWIADLPHEVTFYVARSRGTWSSANVVLFVGRFLLPFVALLSRQLKRTPSLLAAVGGWLVLTSALDFAWLVIPSVGGDLSLFDLAPFVCVLALAWSYGVHLVYVRGRIVRRAGDVPPDRELREALRYRSP